VVDANGEGIAQAWGLRRAVAEEARGFTTTRTDGRYVIGGLEPGVYHVRATRPGMGDAYHSHGGSGSPGERLEVTSSPLSGIDIVMAPGAPPATVVRSSRRSRIRSGCDGDPRHAGGGGGSVRVDVIDVSGRGRAPLRGGER